jgi:restriction system protein
MHSRDQGVDVVAQKNGRRAVLQCKLYARPVGNKSVQEVAAARAHEQANLGIVVSNNRYTKAAEQLADTNDIPLLHYRDFKKFG